MLRLMVTMIANTEAAWSCLEYEKSANMNPQCRRAFQAVEECRIDVDRRLCAPARSIDNLEKCENGRRELIDLRCLPKDCSCDIDDIDATNSTQIAKCIDFRIQYVTNPCFATIENLQKVKKFSIPFDPRYAYENRDSFIPRKYPPQPASPTTPPPIDHRQIATILLIAIGVAILVVLVLIGFLWRASHQKERFEKPDLEEGKMENIVQAELDKFSNNRKEQIPFIQKC